MLHNLEGYSIKAKKLKHYYRRKMPHFQGRGGPIFVTFCTRDQWVLPESVRDKVLEHCRYDHGGKMLLWCAVVMPDHVHLVYQPLFDAGGSPFGLSEIIGSIKGASAHSVNGILKRTGSVWQDESFDHVLRTNESLSEKVDYVRHNPVRKGLCSEPEEYSWLWVYDGEDV